MYVFIYGLSLFDKFISVIPGAGTLAQYSQMLNTAVNSFCGFMHTVLPNTFAMFATYLNMWIGIWFVFFVLRHVLRAIPFVYLGRYVGH